jgi:hypothetical protein
LSITNLEEENKDINDNLEAGDKKDGKTTPQLVVVGAKPDEPGSKQKGCKC